MPPTTLHPGFPRPFGAYLLLQSLGRGGMGEVFLGLRGSLAGAERLCVLKTVRADLKTEAEYARRFVDEARVVVTLHHAAICSVFDVGRVGDTLYLAMEHIPGFTLRQVLDALALHARTPPPGLAVHIVGELLDALDYAHRHRHPATDEPLHIVHRDVSPQNLMLSFEGNVTLIDFGLAESTIKAEETSKDVVQGKVMYMSPEQARGDDVDGRSDQFAAAVLLYEMLVGERYYAGLKPMQVLAATQQAAYHPPGWAKLDAAFTPMLARALSWSAEGRFSSCGDFAAALRMLIGKAVPAMGRSDLRALMHRALGAEITAAEAGVALLRQAAAASATTPTLELLQAVPVETSEASAPTPAVAGEPSLAARDVDTSETHRVIRQSGVHRSRAVPLIAAATLGCAVIAVAVIALRGGHGDPPPPPASHDAGVSELRPVVVEPASVEPASVEPASVEPASVEPASVEPASVEPVVVEPVAPPRANPHKKTRGPAAPPTPAVVPREAAPPVEAPASPSAPPPRAASLDEMVRAVTTWCQLPCTRGLRALAAKGVKLEIASVAPCYERCVGR